MSDVFVSYKAEDRARVRPLVEALQADGLGVWWDAHIEGGASWRESIATNLDAAKCVIVAWSKRSAGPEGRFVRDEAARAFKRSIYLPVTIDKVEPPLGFGETQCLPLTGWKGDRDDPRYLAVLNCARRIVGGGSSAATIERRTDKTSVSRRGVLAGGTVAGLVVVGGGGWYLLRGSTASAASVAVLPFANLSGDPAQAYFSDGLSEELRSSLARIPGLRVVARTSSEMLRDADAKAAAQKLGVAMILSGSVRRSPCMIRVSAQLIDGSSGLERWSQTFDRPPGDVLVVQSNIAENVAQQLRGQFGAADRAALDIGTHSARAQDLVLQARAGANGDETGYRQGMALADAAIALDPNYAPAYAVKSRMLTLWNSYSSKDVAQSQAGLASALIIAQRAVQLDPKLADAYEAQALVLRNQCDMGAAIGQLGRAIALPGCPATVFARYAQCLGDAQIFDRASSMLDRAEALDPLNGDLVGWRAYIAYSARRYPEAISMYSAYLADHPQRIADRNFYAMALLFAGRKADAATQFALLPPEDFHRWVGESALAAGRGDKSVEATRYAQLKAKYGDAASFQYAQMMAQVGDVEGGITALQRAWEVRDTGLPRIKTDPYIDILRRDPRFAGIVAKLNFPAS